MRMRACTGVHACNREKPYNFQGLHGIRRHTGLTLDWMHWPGSLRRFHLQSRWRSKRWG